MDSLIKSLSAGKNKEELLQDNYNTPLSFEEKKEYKKWTNLQNILQNRDITNDAANYDLQGFFKNQEGFANNGHGSDKFKKPNHHTFSDQSQYHNVDGFKGGTWRENTFTPGPSNMYNPLELQNYFDKVEPNVELTDPRFLALRKILVRK
jgi:hypothetical protein